jgi:tRNA nucleotidyltransferase/poly(A) polymerase
MESRLTPSQQRAVSLTADIARAQDFNVYLTGGTIRDLLTGFPIRNIKITVQGNVLKLQKELEKAGATIQGVDDDWKILYVRFPGKVRAEIMMARTESYEKAGRPPVVAPGTIVEDLRRRDFTMNAMALSLNPGSKGLLLDPSNGAADIENKQIRILHNYAFVDEPSRLLRATRFQARFHWPLEERTQARYDAAKENNYIEHVSSKAIGYEIEQMVYEDDPLQIMRAYEKEGWLQVLHPHWSTAKVDTQGLQQFMKLRQQMMDLGYTLDSAAGVLYFITSKLSDKDIADIRKLIPRRDIVDTWKKLEDDAKELAKKLSGKDASTPSRAWKLLSEAKPEHILFTAVTTRVQSAAKKIQDFFGKSRQMKDKLPLPEMVEMRITPDLPEYPKIAEEVFLLMLDGKLRSHTEIVKFLKPFEPPPPPPPAPQKRGRAAKAEAAAAAAAAAGAPKKRRGRPPAVHVDVDVEAEEQEEQGDDSTLVDEIEEALKEMPEDEELEPEEEGEAEEAEAEEEEEEEEERPAKKAAKKPAKKPAKPAKKVAPKKGKKR